MHVNPVGDTPYRLVLLSHRVFVFHWKCMKASISLISCCVPCRTRSFARSWISGSMFLHSQKNDPGRSFFPHFGHDYEPVRDPCVRGNLKTSCKRSHVWCGISFVHSVLRFLPGIAHRSLRGVATRLLRPPLQTGGGGESVSVVIERCLLARRVREGGREGGSLPK